MIRVFFHHGLDLDPVFPHGAAHVENAAGKLLISRSPSFPVAPAIVAKHVSFVVPETGIRVDLIPAFGARGDALAKTALAIIPVVELRIICAVRADIDLTARAVAEMLVDTLFAIKLVTYLRHAAFPAHFPALGARRVCRIFRFLQNLGFCCHGSSPFR